MNDQDPPMPCGVCGKAPVMDPQQYIHLGSLRLFLCKACWTEIADDLVRLGTGGSGHAA